MSTNGQIGPNRANRATFAFTVRSSRPPRQETIMTDVVTPPAPIYPMATRPRFWQRRWVQITGASIVALSIGSAAGAGSVNDKTAALKAASTKVAELRGSLGTANGQVSSLQQQLSDANSAVSQAQKDAANAVDAAKKQVAAQDASTRAALK